MNAALDLLDAVRGTGRRIAVLGDMFELGPEEERLHRELGERAARSADLLILAGERARWTADAARSQGSGAVRYLEDPSRLADDVRREARPGDIILIKASRGMAFERVVEALRAPQGGDSVPAEPGGAAVVAAHPSP